MVTVGGVGEGLSTGILAVVPSGLFSEPPNLVSLHNPSLLQATLPMQEPRVSACNEILCLGLLRGHLSF